MYKFDFREIMNFEEYHTEELKELIILLDNNSIPYVFIKDDFIEKVISVKEFTNTFKFIECELEKHKEYILKIKEEILKYHF